MMLDAEREPSGGEPVQADPAAPAGDGKRRKVTPRKLDEISLADLKKSKPLLLHREPRSAAAVALVDRIVAEVAGCGVVADRPSSVQKARLAAGALLGGLMEREAKGLWAGHGMSKTAFGGRSFSYDAFRPVTDAMRILGYLKIAVGLPRWSTWTDQNSPNGASIISSHGRVTRFRMTEDLIALARSFGIDPVDWKEHWASGKPRKVTAMPEQPRLVLKTHKVRRGRFKDEAKDMVFNPADERPVALLASIEAANAYLARQTIGGIGFPGLRRIFNDGDQPGFAWQWGGRWFSLKGGDQYEVMARDERFERITINGQAIGEADIRASHLTLLYGLLGEPADISPDPYAVDGIGREAVKAWVSHALGAAKVDFKRWSGRAKEKYAEALPGRELSDDYKAAKVGEAVLERHPILVGLPSYGIGPLDLQFHEAEILGRAMAILRDQEDVPALPLHDALIVPVSRLELAGDTLKEAFAAYVEVAIGRPSPVMPLVKLEDR